MATVPQRPEDQEDELRRQLGELAPAPTSGAGAGAAPGAGAGTGGAPQRAPFLGLGAYLEANRGANQALGGKVAGAVSGAGTAARSALGQGVSAFNQAADQATVRDTGLNARLSVDPQGIANNATDRGQLERQRDAQYTGPVSLEERPEYANISKALADAREVGELSKSESGLAELSDRAVTGERTAGGRQLDAQLLRGDETLRGQLDTARQGLEGLAGEVDTASQGAQERVAKARETTDATREATRGALTSAQQAFEKQLDEKVKQQREAATARANAARQALVGANGLPIPTAGSAGRYYAGNDPTQGSFEDRGVAPGAGTTDPAFAQALARYWATPEGKAALDAALQTEPGRAQFAAGMRAGDVPEFIHNAGGQALLPGFDAFAQQRSAAGAQADPAALADLGITPEQWRALQDLAPVAELARSATVGTNNVNPYSFVEDYQTRLGDLGRFATVQNPEATISRDNASGADDYARAAALQQLAGPLLARSILDPAQTARAGTAPRDLVDFDLGGAVAQREAALRALAARAGVHVAGNARSGSDSYFKQFGQSLASPSTLWLGPLAPLKAAADAA